MNNVRNLAEYHATHAATAEQRVQAACLVQDMSQPDAEMPPVCFEDLATMALAGIVLFLSVACALGMASLIVVQVMRWMGWWL